MSCSGHRRWPNTAKLEKERRTFRQEAKEKVREEYDDTMPTIEVDKHIDQFLDNLVGICWTPKMRMKTGTLRLLEYMFQGRARIMESVL
jgi:hypothetical protein